MVKDSEEALILVKMGALIPGKGIGLAAGQIKEGVL